jgi:LDH2 family malate/lactate/ureidoglycolate dehydrogenase
MQPLQQSLDSLMATDRAGLPALIELVADILVRAGVAVQDAGPAANLLVQCQARGIDSHGVAHLPTYLRRMKAGAMDASARPTPYVTGPCTAIVDGRNALGAVVANVALDQACSMAASGGVGVVAVRNSNHFGAAAPLVDAAADRGYVALVFSNAAPTMAPWGGVEGIFGTNPLAAGFPSADGQHVVVDMATSAVARGRIRKAQLEEKSIPADWALDAHGNPTTDPGEALKGTVQPLGGAKGYALAVMVELLTTTLSGGRPGHEVRNPHDRAIEAAGVSHLFVVIDPARFGGADAALQATQNLSGKVQESPAASEGSKPRMPGSRARAVAAENGKVGIKLSPAIVKALSDSIALVSESNHA